MIDIGMMVFKNSKKRGEYIFMLFKKRNDEPSLKKVLIGGRDGSGKSTFAYNYCRENDLREVVIDIEDTNFTDSPLINDLDIGNDRKALKNIEMVLNEISKTDYNCLVLDGVDVFIESLISNAPGLKAYSDRSKNFSKFVKILRKSGLHFILIGQAPILLDWYDGTDENANKPIVRCNAMVNEVYKCVKDGNGKFEVETLKYRKVNI